jgi:two-component system LytT family response regulator
MINAIIIENESKHSKHLSDLLAKHFPEIDLLTTCQSVPDGVMQVNKLKPELLFLDVELQPYTGFDLLEQTPGLNYKVIFTTSHNKYAVRAFEFCALDYLLKPFGIEELKRSINRFKQLTDNGSQNAQLRSLLHNLKQSEIDDLEIYIPVKNGEHKLKLGNIICCATGGNGITFNLAVGESLTISKTLNWMEERLSDYHFFRVHDSYLINLHHVKKITHVREGAEIILSDGKTAEVSKRRKAKFLETIEKLNVIKS